MTPQTRSGATGRRSARQSRRKTQLRISGRPIRKELSFISIELKHFANKPMLKVIEIAFSCYAVTDFVRARRFYEDVLGLKPTKVHDFPPDAHWAEYDIGPGTLSIGSAPTWKPSPDGCSVALEVEDFDAAIAQLRAHNVTFRIEPATTPVCRMAMIFDPDGNSLCIHKRNAGNP
jgi:catechol 2,3-dioxygenase-like lactoylglutathione lyase family enzyme